MRESVCYMLCITGNLTESTRKKKILCDWFVARLFEKNIEPQFAVDACIMSVCE